MTTESQARLRYVDEHSSRYWQALYTHLPEGIALHELVFSDQGEPVDYRFLDVNPQYETYTGLTRDRAVGNLATELYHLENPPHFEEFRDVVLTGIPRTLEVYHAPLERCFNVKVAPLGQYAFATIFTEIPQGRHALPSYFASSLDLACITNEKGTLVQLNSTWQRVLGYAPAELLGKPYLEFVHPDDRDSTLKTVHSVIAGTPTASFENRYRHRDGSYRWLEWRVLGQTTEATPLVCALATDVTERHLAEATLRESEERFRTLFQLSPNPIAIVSLDGMTLVELNRAYCVAVGRSREDLLQGAASCYFLNDPLILESAEPHSKTGGRFDDLEVEYQPPNRPRRIYRVSGRLVTYAGLPHIMMSAFDVTELREAEFAEARSREQLIRVSELAQIGHYSSNIETGEAVWTAELFRIFGQDPERFNPTLTAMRESVLPEDRLHTDKAMVVAAKRCTSQRIEFRVRRPNGDVRQCLSIVEGHVPSDSNPYHLYGLVQDLTDLKRAEEDRRKLEQQVMQAQKLESLGVLAGGIAHDFNNLLTSILGNTDLALSDLPNDNPVCSYLEDIGTVSRRAADLCRQMLAYSGRGRFVIQPIALSQLIEEMADLVSVSTDKRVDIEYNLYGNLPAIMADASQLRQVVINLVTNAAEAIDERNGVIRLTTGVRYCDEVYLHGVVRDSALHMPGQYVYLEVSDNGSGMSPATLEKIFDPFFTTKFTGRGLGLAAVIGIVRGHQGALKVRSKKGEGTTFKVFFPAHHQVSQAAHVTAPAPVRWQAHGLVLLVDDEEMIRSFGRHLLMRAGFEVLTAADGRDALEQFRLRQNEVRVVVLDLTMPHLDGEACFHELRHIDPAVKVIITSGYDEQDVISRFEGQGLAGFVQKPYKAADLLPVIRRTLEV